MVVWGVGEVGGKLKEEGLPVNRLIAGEQGQGHDEGTWDRLSVIRQKRGELACPFLGLELDGVRAEEKDVQQSGLPQQLYQPEEQIDALWVLPRGHCVVHYQGD